MRAAKTCACSGVRWCARCLDRQVRLDHGMDDPLELPDWLCAALTQTPAEHQPEGIDPARQVHRFDPARQSVPDLPEFSGVRVYPDAVSADEARSLLDQIEAEPFLPSQSGKQKQHFGPRFNFTRRRMNADRFEGIPDYAHALEDRLRECVARDRGGDPADRSNCRTALDSYATTDVFVLRYLEAERSNLDFHVDDLHAYGEAILDVSLDSDSVLTFLAPGDDGLCVRVPLPARSIAVVYGEARRTWPHAILARDIRGIRTSITLRTLSPGLRATDAGRRVLDRARRTP